MEHRRRRGVAGDPRARAAAHLPVRSFLSGTLVAGVKRFKCH